MAYLPFTTQTLQTLQAQGCRYVCMQGLWMVATSEGIEQPAFIILPLLADESWLPSQWVEPLDSAELKELLEQQCVPVFMLRE